MVFLPITILQVLLLSSCDQLLSLLQPAKSGSSTYQVVIIVNGGDAATSFDLMSDSRVEWIWAEAFRGTVSSGGIYLASETESWSGAITLPASAELELRVLAGSGDLHADHDIYWEGTAFFTPGSANSLCIALSPVENSPDLVEPDPVMDQPEWAEGFETGDLSANAWVLATVTAYAQEPQVTGNQVATGVYALEFSSREMFSGGRTSASLAVDLPEARILSFRYMTDIGIDVATRFYFYLDDVTLGYWNGLGGTWTQISFSIPAGLHTLRWTLAKDSNYYYPSSTNKVWLDDVTLAPDTTSSMVISPRGSLDLVAGGTGWQFSASSLRSDGSARKGLGYSYSVQNVSGGGGSVDASGYFSPTQAGTCRIRATDSEGFSTVSELITIHPANYWTGPFMYAGHVYHGQLPGGTGNPLNSSSVAVSVSFPDKQAFDADGFFVMTGTISKPAVYDYAWVRVVKDDTGESTSYFLRGNFVQRIWLRFGQGSYTASVLELSSLTIDLSGEGDFGGWSYSVTPRYSFIINNIRDEDGVFFYPSAAIQSDDFTISNIRNDLTVGLANKTDRIKSFHDYVVQYLHYDYDSLYPGQRKKQDTLSTLANGTAVCEGYTSLMAALLRSDGIRTKAVSGYAGGAHAWNNLLLDGIWYFLDATWNDPYEEGDDRVRYDYYLLTTLDGINGDHTAVNDRPDRAIGVVGNPSWQGMPDGWY
jgi:hypothetical protein